MTKILVVLNYYLPGYKAGGPTSAVENLVSALSDQFEFFILTSDHDLNDSQPYPNIKYGRWQSVGQAQVRYLAPSEWQLVSLHRLLNSINYDALYLDSFFSKTTIRVLLLRRLGKLPVKPVVLAPRGALSAGALRLKRYKKIPYRFLAKWLGLYRNVTWQASSEYERQDIIREFPGDDEHIKIAIDLPPRNLDGVASMSQAIKEPGQASIIFLSRIVRKKNLDYALRLLGTVAGEIQFDIYGPVQDPGYWRECRALIQQLPANVQVVYHGILSHEDAVNKFASYHLFFFPTLTENFGYVILEALMAGCPVLTSNQTPWCGLAQRQAGWNLPLSDIKAMTEALNAIVAMDDEAFVRHAQAAQRVAADFIADQSLVDASKQLFDEALKG